MLFEKVPSVKEQFLHELNLNVDEYKKKFSRVYRQWAMNSPTVRDQTDEGRMLFSAVKKCIADKSYMVVLADDYQQFNQHCSDKKVNQEQLLYWLNIACAFGSKKIATAIINTLKLDLSQLSEGSNNLFALIAAADIEWLGEVLDKHDHKAVPDSAYTYVTMIESRRVKQLDEKLQQAHANDVAIDDSSVLPSHDEQDDKAARDDSIKLPPPQ